MKVLKSTFGVRITSDEEEAGIDFVSFGVKSYTNEKFNSIINEKN